MDVHNEEQISESNESTHLLADAAESNESTLLLADEAESNGAESNESTHHIADETESQTRITSEECHHGVGSTTAFNFKWLMIVPMCACYFFAGGIYMYIVPQYIQTVIEENEEKHLPHQTLSHVPHVIFSHYIYQIQEETSLTASNPCSASSKSNGTNKDIDHIQQETAKWIIYFNISVLLPAVFTNLIWASFSDVLGRKFAIFLCLATLTLRLTIFAFVIYFKLSLGYALIGNIIDGMAGTYTSLFAILFSYVSDITYSGKQRTIAIVVVELVIGLSFTISSLVSGHLIDKFGFFYPSVVVSVISALGILILIFLVPETMPRSNTGRRGRDILKSLGESVRLYFCEGTKVKRAKYILLILAFFFMGVPAMSRVSIELLYQLGPPFCWSPTKIGWFGAIKMFVASLFGIGGAYLFKKCVADDTIAFYSLILTAAGLIVEGLAKTDFALYSVTVIAAPSGLPFPMIRSLMSCLTPTDKQGAIFASIGFVETLCSLIGSVSSSAIYAATLTVMNGFVFLLMAGLTLVGAIFLLAFMVVQRKYKESSDDAEVIVNPEMNGQDS